MAISQRYHPHTSAKVWESRWKTKAFSFQKLYCRDSRSQAKAEQSKSRWILGRKMSVLLGDIVNLSSVGVSSISEMASITSSTGTLVKGLTTSKLSIMSNSSRGVSWIFFTKWVEFLMEELLQAEREFLPVLQSNHRSEDQLWRV